MDEDQTDGVVRRVVTVSKPEATTICSVLPQSRHLKNRVLCRWSSRYYGRSTASRRFWWVEPPRYSERSARLVTDNARQSVRQDKSHKVCRSAGRGTLATSTMLRTLQSSDATCRFGYRVVPAQLSTLCKKSHPWHRLLFSRGVVRRLTLAESI